MPDARQALRWAGRALTGITALFLLLALSYTVLNPPTTAYMLAESIRYGGIKRNWVSIEEMSADVPRAVVAAEDANFCLHWGFDMAAIREAIEQGGTRGASTLTQQTVKNVFLWHGRSWPRKALEAVMTPVVELLWSKRRTLEIYLNVAEFGKGVFGIEAAAQHYFGTSAKDLSGARAALLAAALPNPKERNPARPSGFLRKRARQIAEGADTINVDGRADCFQG
ncbi:monofunctional biosynthetic peptidoglycan transglycosylase [Defluviimonas sp. WL0002]|uniref:Biosynthetic peptidoglycan transglycosylase n=2 Tax=Albidovulum marisflavi TaxID=2984159 RepID=A0ABT2Z876_9RHOB|nr:monofunctional biosynthetic peptidoglycan transglycosylase [Defluviimonas sp. WL0002]MCV2867338.1 monofunctional biosynthetic peptidoglycan transglycosylase [Defluviimonas sp. WL0002]